MNGDGFADVMISAPGSYTDTRMRSEVPFNSGRLYLYFGDPGGLGAVPILFDRVRPTDSFDNPGFFASYIASPGDLNGDGFDDMIIHDLGRSTLCYVMGSTVLNGAQLSGCRAAPGYGYGIY